MTDTMREIMSRCDEADYLVWDLEEQLRIIHRRFEACTNDERYAIYVNAGVNAEIALRSGFEKYRTMDRSYPAIWSEELGAVECELRSVHDKIIDTDLTKKGLTYVVMFAFGKDPEDTGPESRIKIPSRGGPCITVGPCSEAFAIHFDTLEYAMDVDAYNKLYDVMEEAGVEPDAAYQVVGINHHLTLRIEGVRMASEEDARKVLMKLGNGVLFELDSVPELGLSMPLLSRIEERDVHPAEIVASEQGLHPPELHKDYDPDPLFLYWYARSIPEMPLIQFLAYYQILEYFFPAYSRTKAIAALREKLREIYGVARETDVTGIFQALRANRRAIFGQERDQLRHAIEECVTSEELQDFLGDEERRRFYRDRRSLDISTVKLAVDSTSADHRGDAARRVYEIRNRIVHTKSEHDDLDPLLPFDPEVDLLKHDIELVCYLARRVLAASAKPLEESSN